MGAGLDFEKARFNMVEQQVRPWDVLDQSVLDLLFVVKREEFVPPAYRALAFTDMEIPLRFDDVDTGEFMWAPKLEARIVQEVAIKPHDTVLEIAREIGYRHFTLPSAWREAYARGQYRDLVPRIGSRDRVRWRSRDLGRPTPREFVWHIESARNSKRHRLLHRCAISARLGWSYLKRSID